MMLQRAASNAYSWWWASHIRTKQSKWLEQNLQDIEEKVQYVLKLLEEEGDSFAKRAEMYYKRRPELISFVEESFKAYRALAERYDHLSRDLQNANTTIASVCPDRVPQFSMDDDDDYEATRRFRKRPPDMSKSNNVPSVPKLPVKDSNGIVATAAKKLQPRKSMKFTGSSTPVIKTSGLSKPQAMEEIDKLQKEILTLQTEKEFLKSCYENGLAKYWDIENEIKEKHERICNLQDEFGENIVIEDDEARRIMAETAIKSCKKKLMELQEKQEKALGEVKIERERIRESRGRLTSFMGQLPGSEVAQESSSVKYEELEQEMTNAMEKQKELESLQEKIKEHFDIGSNSSLTVTEMAEKIDELVNKMLSLETAVSSQNALIQRLRTETNDLQSQIRTLEDDKVNLIDDKNNLRERLMEMEQKFKGLQEIEKSIEEKSDNLQTHFTDASCNLDHLSVKLHEVKLDEEIDISAMNASLEKQVGEQAAVLNDESEKQPNTEVEPDINAIGTPKKEHVTKVRFKDQEETPEKGGGPELGQGVRRETEAGVFTEEAEPAIAAIREAEAAATASAAAAKEAEMADAAAKEAETAAAAAKEAEAAAAAAKEAEAAAAASAAAAKEAETAAAAAKEAETAAAAAKEAETAAAAAKEAEAAVAAAKEAEAAATASAAAAKEAETAAAAAKEAETAAAAAKEAEAAAAAAKEAEAAATASAAAAKEAETVAAAAKEAETAAAAAKEAETAAAAAKEAETAAAAAKEAEAAAAAAMKEAETAAAAMKEAETAAAMEDAIAAVAAKEAENIDQLLLSGGSDTAPSKGQNSLPGKQISSEKEDSIPNITESSGPNSALEKQVSSKGEPQEEHTEKNDEPDWKQLFLKGMEDREKLLLSEYTQVLRNFKDIKKRFNETESQLKDANASKDDEIRLLREKLSLMQKGLDDYNDFANNQQDDENALRMATLDQSENMSPIEAEFRTSIDELLEENLDFWLRFSAAFGQIQKFDSSIGDLQAEISKFEERKKQDGSSTARYALRSDVRPIYRHLREIQTELSLWSEKGAELKDELKSRFESLCNIQDEITKALKASAEDDDFKFTSYQAAKFHGEILNMKQENNKVANELQAGLDHVNALQLEINKTLSKLGDEFGLSGSKNQSQLEHSGSRTRIPLRSFIFGTKEKKQKPSLFAIMHPSQYKKMKASSQAT